MLNYDIIDVSERIDVVHQKGVMFVTIGISYSFMF